MIRAASFLSLAAVVLFSAPALRADEKIVRTADGNFCCTKHYDPCELGCIAEGFCAAKCEPHPSCLKKCLAEHCSTKTGACGGGIARGGASTGGRIRYDGELTGPGVVNYEVYNRATDVDSLTVVGIIYGRDRGSGARKVLSRSEEVVVIPSVSSEFSLEVSDRTFADWTKIYDELTVAISLASEKNAGKWRYENLLTEADAKSAEKGKFLVKGAFHPAGGAK